MKKLLLATLTTVLLAAAPADAANPLQNAYGGPGQIVAEVTPSGDGKNTGDTAPAGRPAQAVKNTGYDTAPAGRAAQAVKNTGYDTAPAGRAAQANLSGSLPFTGSDSLLMLLGGGVLVAVGFGMRRLARPPA